MVEMVVGLTVERVEGLIVELTVERVVEVTVELTVEMVVGLKVEPVVELSPYSMQPTPSSVSSPRTATFSFLHIHIQNSSHLPGLDRYLAAFVNDVKLTKVMTMVLKSTVKQEDFVKFWNWQNLIMKYSCVQNSIENFVFST